MAFDGVTFVTTDAVKWGTGKGSPLTATEADLDLWELLRRLKLLETNPPTAVSISNIIVSGTQMQINMSNGTFFGPFTLPIATFQFRGDFVAGTTYFELDLISVPGSGLYLARLGHVGVAPFDPARTIAGNAVYLKVFGEDTFIYDFGWFYPGRPGNGIEIGGAMAAHVLVRAVTLPLGLVGSRAELVTAPALPLSFDLKKELVTIGSINFAAGATQGTFTFAADVVLAIGDQVRLIRPVAIDTAARELSVTLIANHS